VEAFAAHAVVGRHDRQWGFAACGFEAVVVWCGGGRVVQPALELLCSGHADPARCGADGGVVLAVASACARA
jgi:hypothetical protein